MQPTASHYVRAASLAEVQQAGKLAVQAGGHALALFAHGERVYAVDNRCPHMGFPLDRGTVQDGILTCHWHHARFDLASGGTFDQFAGDVRAFPVEIRDGEVWVDLAPRGDTAAYLRQRMTDGLERDIPLVLAKAVLAWLEAVPDPGEPFRVGLDFGTRYRQAGWGQGLTIHTCMMNLLPHLEPADQPRALYHGLSAVAAACAGAPPRFPLPPLPGPPRDLLTLKRWFRRFVEVRDGEGVERCVASAVAAGAGSAQMADMLFAAATDHRYLQTGHVLDFTNKALEALDRAGWDQAGPVLASLAPAYATAGRMEESSAWRYPIDLIALLDRAFDHLLEAWEVGQRGRAASAASPASSLVELLPADLLLGEDPAATTEALLAAVRAGWPSEQIAGRVAYAAALRIAHFHTSNEFGDWDTALHTFTFANAVQQGLRRAPSPELLRGVFDAAMSVYLDRFLNVPAARLPGPDAIPARGAAGPAALLEDLGALLDRQQQVNEAAEVVAQYLYAGGDPGRLVARLGRLLLREDRDFHTIQALEAAVRQARDGGEPGIHVLVAATRYLAAHAPTMRAQGQTYQIAQRLERGEKLFEG